MKESASQITKEIGKKTMSTGVKRMSGRGVKAKTYQGRRRGKKERPPAKLPSKYILTESKETAR